MSSKKCSLAKLKVKTRTDLEDETIALMTQLRNEVFQQFASLRQGPEIFSPDPEGLLIVSIKADGLLHL